jgi:hypothetical protein
VWDKIIEYRNGYTYQLTKEYVYQLPVSCPDLSAPIDTDYLFLGTNHELIISRGYAWDGPSGPTIDTKNFLRGSLIHDALYQLCRLGYLNSDQYRPLADQILYQVCREDGMSWVRACYIYYGVRWGAKWATKRGTEKPTQIAPRKSPGQGL